MLSVSAIWFPEFSPEFPPSIRDSQSLIFGPESYGSCANTAALTVNILLGDSIVCWRASLLWPGNRVVRGVSITLLLATFALGAVDIRFTCLFHDQSVESLFENLRVVGGMYGGTSYGVAASALSLGVNLFATIIVAFKAWSSRKFLRKFMVSGNRTTQVERLFSILIESGMVYCAIWILVVVWQFSSYVLTYSTSTFYEQFGQFISGGLVPFIAIYPAVVIILIAQNRSHMVKALGGPAINTPESSRLDSTRLSDATVLRIARQDNHVRDGPEESNIHTADERPMDSSGIE
ncbi:hypothetical protein BD311DRAFT_734259 [Dichomitus squalens]|uniref:Uncharacterized protein n=1 Tax=Dichomitus squalens TaxID=114155 RepID=A0A4Q9M3W2_9APHY|nr:hypothetical protein BD311DRAFT_734259 [Dichomitus squalens]